jgi:SET domain-containing protein
MHTPKRVHGYTAPETIVKKSSIHGIGVFARKNIRKGKVVVVWGGHILTKAEIKKLPKDISTNYALPVYPGFYIAEINHEEVGDAERVNHSCEPNCIIKNSLIMLTKRNIAKGEELTCDFDCGRGVGIRTRCVCGSKCCKQYVYF